MGSGASISSSSTADTAFLAAQAAALKLELRDHPRGGELVIAIDSLEGSLSETMQRLRTEIQDLKAQLAAKNKNNNASAHSDDEDESDLPPELREFKPLGHDHGVRKLARSASLREAESAMQHSPGEEATAALKQELGRLAAAMQTARDLRLRQPGILQKCQSAVVAGNKDFVGVYDAVWKTISHNEAEGLAAYCGAVEAAAFPAAGATQGASTVVELLRDGAAAKTRYEAVVRGIVAAALAAGTAEVTIPATLKKTPRILEKTLLRADAPGNPDRIMDVVRGMIVCQRMADVAKVVAGFTSSPDLSLVRAKERFVRDDTSGGWRDCMLNFFLAQDENKHICEVQLVHSRMLTARKGLPGHIIYNRVRNATEIAEALSNHALFGLNAAEAAVAGVSAARLTTYRADVEQLVHVGKRLRAALPGLRRSHEALVEECQHDLAAAMPALRGVDQSLMCLKSSDLRKLEAFKKPPSGAVLAVAAVATLMQWKGSKKGVYDWGVLKKMLKDRRFVERLKCYDKDNISDKVRKKMRKYMSNPDFVPESIKKCSSAAESLCEWARAIMAYDAIARALKPKRQNLIEIEQAQAQVLADSKVVQAQTGPITTLWGSVQDHVSNKDDNDAAELLRRLAAVRAALDEQELAAALARCLAFPWMKEGEVLPGLEDEDDAREAAAEDAYDAEAEGPVSPAPEGCKPMLVERKNLAGRYGLVQKGAGLASRVRYKLFDITEVREEIKKLGFYSDFFPFKKEIQGYPDDEQLLLIADPKKTYGQNWLLCISVAARDAQLQALRAGDEDADAAQHNAETEKKNGGGGGDEEKKDDI